MDIQTEIPQLVKKNPKMLPFQQAVASDLTAVNTLILKQLHSDVGLVENIGHYIIDAGGKRLRPILVLLTYNCLCSHAQQLGDKHVQLATIIEFIHTATLLHDDVVDISSLRRGRPTANAEFGNAPSVLVGDFLYSRAFQMLVAIGDMEIMSILSNTTNIIAEGEVQQLVNAKNPNITEADYFQVIHKKTGVLFEAACSTAAVLADANTLQRQAALKYGYHLGLTFQLIDDVLDYQGSQDALGKNIGDDLAEGKATLPLIYALEHGLPDERELIKSAIIEGGIDHLDEIIHIVKRCGALEYTQAKAKHHAQQAQNALQQLEDNPFKQAMSELAYFSVDRQF